MKDTGIMLARLSDAFGGSVAVERAEGQPLVVAAKEKLREVLIFLKGDENLAFTMLTDLFAVDYYHRIPRFEVVYLLTSLKLNNRLTVKVKVADGEHVPTVSDVWRAADWLEREAYDMFGITFDNHPDLRRILMIEEFDGHPLRKDFPTEGHGFNEPFSIYLEEENR
jgi:NADH-quinone oxidoreductase subunit C